MEIKAFAVKLIPREQIDFNLLQSVLQDVILMRKASVKIEKLLDLMTNEERQHQMYVLLSREAEITRNSVRFCERASNPSN